MQELSLLQTLSIAILPVIFAITIHEVAHGWMALQLGDRTAQMLGRLTLNPIKHIDPIGTLLVPGLLLAFSGAMFGWAKPVPVTWENLHRPRRDMALVAMAGPLANLLMAMFWAVMAAVAEKTGGPNSYLGLPLFLMADIGVTINLVLMLLNLLPILPLDGGRIVHSLLPGAWAWRFGRLEPLGLVVILVLWGLGWLWPIITWPFVNLKTAMFTLVGL